MTAKEVGARTSQGGDLQAASNFHQNHLFLHIKTFLSGQHLMSDHETRDAVQKRLNCLTVKFFGEGTISLYDTKVP
jgi:hypothetical protein